ncbi:uncharacterized protein LOC131880234 isoform X3 [Tigriopus californicus]|nr:uncharacterized protein LOC131880234 isoform X3 [Tigriopus californicus]XP_059082792.1 uncharacterized protein LOC131880234 isoform X3 [Tigriopus californicus]
MSLKKKSKSLGHLTALGSPNFGSPKMKKQISSKNFNSSVSEAVQGKLKFLNGHDLKAHHGSPMIQSGSNNNQHHPHHHHHYMPSRSTTALSMGGLAYDEANGRPAGQFEAGTSTNSPVRGAIKTTTPKKLKGLVRQKTNNSMPNPMAMGRAIFQKANNLTHKTSQNGRTESTIADVFGSKDAGLIPNKHRTFLMDTQVKYTVGLQSQERNLFLFNDLLLVAKERSASHFKLKDQIPLSDIWLSTCISEVSEVTLDPTTSFVIGWPITNAVITFSSPSQKSLWWDKLRELVEKERSHTPQSTNVQVTYFDQATNFEHMKSIYVSVEDSSRDCIRTALKALDLLAADQKDTDFQLWVRTKFDEAPYPLIGHELPLVIKLHWTRQAFNSRNQKSYDEYKAGCRCSFILRKVGQMPNLDIIGSQKTKLKKVKSSIKLQNVFRRVSQGSKASDLGVDGSNPGSSPKSDKKLGKLFCLPLDEVCPNNLMPKAIEAMLVQILKEGPSTVGIFRRSPNARAMRELREKLDQNEVVDFTECSVFVTAALLKDFLRSLPDCLLMCEHYNTWNQLAQVFEDNKNVESIKSFISTLPRMNGLLLQHVLYLLFQIASHSQENMMTASNLAICVGPSILWSSDNAVMMDQQFSKQVSCVAQILIEEYNTLYKGDLTPYAFSEPSDKTIHHPSQKSSRKLYDNSSLDSLLDANHFGESDLLLSQQSGTEGVSLTNLSHDSGLTTSDSQLYAFEENNSLSSDEFCIENVAKDRPHNNNNGSSNNKHRIMPKYPTYNQDLTGDFILPGQVPNGSVRSGKQGSSKIPIHQNHFAISSGGSKTGKHRVINNHRDRIYKRMQRHNNTNSQSHPNVPTTPTSHFGSKYASGINDADQAFMIDTTSFTLRRTASEESVSHGPAQVSSVPSSSRSSRRRPVVHRKGKAPAPPNDGPFLSSNIVRSNSVNQVRGRDMEHGSKHRSSDWYRSRSTTRLNHNPPNQHHHHHHHHHHTQDMTSSSCSTLSDEDSTPHVSRSNSYGKTEETNQGYASSTKITNDGSYDIYLHDDHLTVGGEAFITTTPVPKGTPTSNPNCDTPPGYEETISRQRLLKHYNRSNSFVLSTSNISPSPNTTSSQKRLSEIQNSSAKARLFNESPQPHVTTSGNPPPLPPKTERPPLPPKQRIMRLSAEDTYVNSDDLKLLEDEKDSDVLVYPNFTPARIHVNPSPVPFVNGVKVPQLPPKESASGSESDTPRKARRSVTKIKGVTAASTQTKTMCNAETQTDETDFYLLYGEDEWEAMLNAEEQMNEDFSESHRSLSPEYYPAFNRGAPLDNPEYISHNGNRNSVPGHLVNGTSITAPTRNATSVLELRQAGRRKLEPVQSVPLTASHGSGTPVPGKLGVAGVAGVAGVDPVIQGEINWSVSQLRSLFNQSGQATANGSQHSPTGGGSSSSASSTTSHLGGRFTNGEYIDSSSSATKAVARQIMLNGGVNANGHSLYEDRGNKASTIYSSKDCENNDLADDSDQESYV